MTFFPLFTIIMQALVYVVVIAWERVGLQIIRVQIGLLPASPDLNKIICLQIEKKGQGIYRN